MDGSDLLRLVDAIHRERNVDKELLFQGLEHLGFGDFASDTHLFLRCDSPRTTRFYEKVERNI